MMSFGEYLEEGYKRSSKTKKELKDLVDLASDWGYSVEDDEEEVNGEQNYNLFDDGGDQMKSGSYGKLKKFLTIKTK
jgi:hypothetical protein